MNLKTYKNISADKSCNTAATPPYHLYKYANEHFIYDTFNCVFFHIDKPTSDLLQLALEMPYEDAKNIFVESYDYSEEKKQSVIKEVSVMASEGLFVSPDYRITDEKFEHQLNQRYNSPWSKLELSLSEVCNLACKYCYCSTCRDIKTQGLMSERVARAAINWLFANSGNSSQVSITLFGGEPLLNKPVLKFAVDYSQRLAKLHGKSVYYSMTTNGTLIDDEIIDYIKRYNFGLMVSLDGPKELHDNQCPTQNGEGSWDAAVYGIKRLMARRRSVTVRSTLIHPLPRMLELIKFYENFGFTRIVMGKATNPVNPSGVDCTEEDIDEYFRQEREELIPWILSKLKKGETPKYFPYSNFIKYQEDGKATRNVSPFKCGACRGTMTVGADGTLYPCHRFVGMKEWQLGNIADGPDYEKCKNFWRRYKHAVSGKCDTCWAWTQCKGPCPWEMANSDGSFKSPKDCKYMERFLGAASYVLFNKQGEGK